MLMRCRDGNGENAYLEAGPMLPLACVKSSSSPAVEVEVKWSTNGCNANDPYFINVEGLLGHSQLPVYLEPEVPWSWTITYPTGQIGAWLVVSKV